MQSFPSLSYRSTIILGYETVAEPCHIFLRKHDFLNMEDDTKRGVIKGRSYILLGENHRFLEALIIHVLIVEDKECDALKEIFHNLLYT